MIDGAGAVGPRNWHGLWRRSRAERWARAVISAIRCRQLILSLEVLRRSSPTTAIHPVRCSSCPSQPSSSSTYCI